MMALDVDVAMTTFDHHLEQINLRHSLETFRAPLYYALTVAAQERSKKEATEIKFNKKRGKKQYSYISKENILFGKRYSTEIKACFFQ